MRLVRTVMLLKLIMRRLKARVVTKMLNQYCNTLCP